ncbi:type III-B CRISPR module-associated Cmr3 family protein [Clostridiisalibacter paucivorans]|uniref:type III-B CRISPR module-associated Cmr3 family protein n=1 Tax=Clostridiisalibacter paucivorans TaxID=408753 RepID=UPI00047C313B|nr:type III-B CRISPR module-associated Cmr3 family protein [Clostridiisalibacter paucivorans]
MKYLIKLKPIENFFFGGEKTFENKNEKGERENYIVTSKDFPQQTTILGMIRKEIIRQKGLLKSNWNYNNKEMEKIKGLIGKGSFNINNTDQEFGIINKISPVFLYSSKENNFYIKMPKDQNLKCENSTKKYIPFKAEKRVKSNFGQVLLPEEYNAKKGLSNQFISFDGKNIKEYKDIFSEDKRVGNKKNVENELEKETLFKEISYRLNPKICFCFTLDIRDNDFNLEDNIVYLGANKSAFKMEVEKTDIDLIERIKIERNNDRVLLLGDTYIEDVSEYCQFYVATTTDFRNRTTRYFLDKTKNKYTFNRINTKYTFLEKGSVFYLKLEKKEEFKKKLEEKKNMRKIGYNIYLD